MLRPDSGRVVACRPGGRGEWSEIAQAGGMGREGAGVASAMMSRGEGEAREARK